MNKPDGYRYVRSYRVKNNGHHWALYEVVGGKAKRLGTAKSEGEYLVWLGFPADFSRKVNA